MNNSILVKAEKREIMKIITDPFRLFGIISHINILQVFDEENKVFTTLDKINKFPKKFRVMYIFGTPDTGIKTFLGFAEGPNIIPNGVKYQGNSEDETFYWEIEIFVTERIEASNIVFNMNTIYKPKVVQKLLGKDVKELKPDFNFPDHVLKAHLIPYFKFFSGDTLLTEQQ
ncbi:hypothetical protein [Sulfurisphaera ohwakuensis]|uniref:hypothetical protein n=1 Tax=Sulfurisphaera ohwakuensis TaxID=69656 RepID=UPI0036F3AEA3